MNGHNGEKIVSLHIVMGTIDKYKFSNLLNVCKDMRIGCTLLGYKSVGFGADYEPQPYGWWLEMVKEKGIRVSVDTQIASEYEQQILEGAFSCYIDAVQKKMGPSSFCPEEQMVDVELRYGEKAEEIQRVFQSFEITNDRGRSPGRSGNS